MCITLVNLTSGIIEQERIVYNTPRTGFGILSDSGTRAAIIGVFPGIRQVVVYSERYFDKALKLAQVYETHIGEAFTLKKEY